MYTGKLTKVVLEAAMKVVTKQYSSEIRPRMYMVRFALLKSR